MSVIETPDAPLNERIRLRVNGELHDIVVAVNKTLLEVLREDLGLTGTKHGCELGECGTCTVLIDGEPMLSCLVLPIELQGRAVETVESLARHGQPHELQVAFAELGASQCGYCTPGIMMSAAALLEENPEPDVDEIKARLAGNLCRCTGYLQIIEAIQTAARRRAARRGELTAEPEGASRELGAAPCPEAASLGRGGGGMSEQTGPRTPEEHYSVIGKPLPKVDGLRKATGQTVYSDDLMLPRMLYGKLLGSRRPHARIVNIDTSGAAAVAGVEAIITGKDLPVQYGILPVSEDEYPLEIDRVRFVGDPIVAVAAIDEATAEEAVRRIEVEYEDLPTAFDIEEGLSPVDEADRIHDYGARDNVHKEVNLEFGDLEAGFAAADHVFENTYFYSGSNHLAMEQHAAVASWGADGRLTLWSSTQTPHYVHKAMARVLQVPASRIRVIATPVGGGFGGKSDPFPHEFCAAKLSMLTGRPVKITLTREEVFYAHRGRHPVLMHVKMGVKEDGSITALDFQSFVDGGGYGSYGVASTYYTGALQTVTYKIPAYRFRGVRVFTNKPPCGPKRGHGTPQPRFALECLLDRVAEALGLDPAAYRRAIRVDEYSMTVNHMRVTSCGLAECIDKAVAASGFSTRRGRLPEGKGIGLAVGAYLSGAGLPVYWNKMPHSSVDVKVDRGGGVSAKCMQIDIGQGSDTVLAMTIAEVLGIDPGGVQLTCADTDTTPIDLGSYSSRVTFMMGNAAIEAAGKIRERLFAAAAEALDVDAAGLSAAHGTIHHPSGKSMAFTEAVPLAEARFGQLSASGSYTPQNLGGPYKGSGVGPTPAYSYSVAVVLVHVDVETGIVTPEQVWIAHDIGRAINPTLVRGQVEGCVYMALGEIFMEEQAFRKGLHQFPSMLDTKSPTILEMPPVETLLVESIDAEGPFGAKEVGQGPLLPMPPAVANAIYDAVGVRIDELPITPEKVLAALDSKHRGGDGRVGPAAVPAYDWPPPIVVDPVWYDQPPEDWVETRRRPESDSAEPAAPEDT